MRQLHIILLCSRPSEYVDLLLAFRDTTLRVKKLISVYADAGGKDSTSALAEVSAAVTDACTKKPGDIEATVKFASELLGVGAEQLAILTNRVSPCLRGHDQADEETGNCKRAAETSCVNQIGPYL